MAKWKTHPIYAEISVSDAGGVRRNGVEVRPTLVRIEKTGKPECLVVGLGINGRRITRRVHRLVLETFVGFRQEGQVCCHANGDATDNRLRNLRWATQYDNIHDAMAHGTFVTAPGFKKQKGSDNHQARLKPGQVLEIRERRAKGETLACIGARFSLHPAYISLIINRKRWSHI